MNIIDQSALIREFLEKYSDSGLSALGDKLDSPANEHTMTHFAQNISRHQYGGMHENGDIALMMLKNDQTNATIAKYYERNSMVMGFKDGVTQLTDNPVRYGVCEYYYPNGNIAGLEVYSGETGPTGLLPKDSIYFDPEKNVIERPMFDVLFRSEHELTRKDERYEPVPEYAPRIEGYNTLVRNLSDEYRDNSDKITPQDIRELVLSDKPAQYLDMLAKDTASYHDFSCAKTVGEHSEYVDMMNDLFIYGKNNISKPGTESDIFNETILGGIGVDMSHMHQVSLSDAGKYFSCSLGNPNGPAQDALYQNTYGYSQIYNAKSSDSTAEGLKVIIDRDQNGRMMSRRTEDGILAFAGVEQAPIIYRNSSSLIPHDRSMEFFYPDGTLCISGKEMTGDPLSFDANGNICNFAKARNSFDAAWGVHKNYIDITYDVSNPQGATQLMNGLQTGFDSRVLLMEVDGKAQGYKESLDGLQGKHTVRLHLDPTVSSPIPENLLKGIDGVVDVRSVSDDPALQQFEVNWCINNPTEALAATTSESLKERRNIFGMPEPDQPAKSQQTQQ